MKTNDCKKYLVISHDGEESGTFYWDFVVLNTEEADKAKAEVMATAEVMQARPYCDAADAICLTELRSIVSNLAKTNRKTTTRELSEIAAGVI